MNCLMAVGELLPSTRLHHALALRIAAMTRGLRRPMQHSNHQQGAFIRRVRNQVITYRREPYRARGEVRPPVALMGERHQRADGGPRAQPLP